MNTVTLAIITAGLGFAALFAAGKPRSMVIVPGKTYRITLLLDPSVDAEDLKARFREVGGQFMKQQGREVEFLMSPGTELEVHVPSPLPGFEGVTTTSVVEI